MVSRKNAVIGSLSGAALFGVLWHEFFTYARSLVYDWLLAEVLGRSDSSDPRVVAAAKFLALWGPIILVGLIVWAAVWWTTRQHRKRFKRSTTPLFPALNEADRRASYMEALKGAPAASPDGRRNVSFAEALGWAIYGTWDKPYMHSPLAIQIGAGAIDPRKIIARFSSLASDGKLTVWGRRADPGYYEEIPRSHWADNSLRIADIIGNVTTGGGDAYGQLMLNRAEVEREWPHAG